jgi:REP element-mobilizing transposase RayT
MPLFDLTNGYEHVYKWFYYLKERKRISVVSYVIMPNHLHVILHLPDHSLQLNKVIGNGKRFIAYSIINDLERMERYDILDVLYGSVTRRERNKGQKHRVFEESFDAKEIYTKRFLDQKMDYIHHNPARGKWQLANNFTLYPHSSAAFYETGKAFFFEPIHYDELGYQDSISLSSERGPETETPL